MKQAKKNIRTRDGISLMVTGFFVILISSSFFGETIVSKVGCSIGEAVGTILIFCGAILLLHNSKGDGNEKNAPKKS